MNRDKLRIKEPCHADWSAMDGDDKKRFCGECTKHVHDLSAMTEPQATAVLTTVEEPCVRYTCSPDGTVRFKPSRRVFLARAGMVAGGLMIGGTAAAAVIPQETGESCGQKSLLDTLSDAFWSLFEEEEEPEVMLGGLEAIEPPPEEELEVLKGEIEPFVEHTEPPPVVEAVEPIQPMMGQPVLPIQLNEESTE